MNHYSIKFSLPALLLLLFSTSPGALAQQAPVARNQQASTALSENEKISRLISFVGNLQGATFIRNGNKHSPKDAAAHLRSKFDKHHAKIKTAHEFIELLATKSSASGEYYKIKMADGTTTETYKILSNELVKLEAEKMAK
ncbi:DUF5329 family protein [Pontibacter sp. 13R65]|uniref:DUF5329 family protein n=1 Tax=Pontibacter sp. 13R65 TaxID=3127458 RepID=UPI00301DBF5A